MTDFQKRLKAAIEAKGVSLRQLAAETGLTRRAIQGLVNDGRTPTVRSVKLLAEVLGQRLCAILGRPCRKEDQ